MDKPLVTIAIPTFNRSGYLQKSIDSVLSQTFRDFELLVIDAASKDDTPNVVALYDDPRIHYYRLEKDPGSVESQNLGISLASGEFISILHDDDMLTSHFLERSLSCFKVNPQVGMVFSDVTFIDKDGKPIGSERYGSHDRILKVPELFKRLLVECPTIFTPSVIIRKSCYEKIDQFETKIRCMIDWDMWLRVAIAFETGYVCEPLALYRWYPGSDSRNRQFSELEKEQDFIIAKIQHLVDSTSPNIRRQLKDAQKVCRFHCKMRTARKYYALGQGSNVRQYIFEALPVFPLITIKNSPTILFMFFSSLLGAQMMKRFTSTKDFLISISDLRGIHWKK